MQSLSAACAIHPDLEAVFTCERCGVFGCEDCRGPSLPSLCQVCVQRAQPTGELTARVLLQDSFRLLVRNPSGVGLMVGVYLLHPVLPIVLPNLDRDGLPFLVLSCCVTSFAAGAFLSWTAAGLLQQPRSLLMSLGGALLRLPILLPMYVFWTQLMGGPLLLFMLPVLYLALCLSLAPALVMLDGLDPLESVQRSYQLTRGYRLTLMVVFAVSAALQLVWLVLSRWSLTFFPGLEASPWLWPSLSALVCALCSSLHYCAVVLAWMRLTGRVPSP